MRSSCPATTTSRAQGEFAKTAGGVGAGTVPVFIRNLDACVPVAVPGLGTTTLPASGGVATLPNRHALEVNAVGGDPWVRTESPVSSIDRKVTRAVRALDAR